MTAVEITVNLDFRCSYKSKNNGEKLLPRSLVMQLFGEAETFLYQVSRTSVDTDVSSVAFCLQKIYHSKAFV